MLAACTQADALWRRVPRQVPAASRDMRCVALARESAAAGSRFGQHTVGWCYDRGLGVAQDCREARRWYRLAVAQGHAEAQHNLGTLFHNRDLPSRNADKKAARWFSLAAAQGHARSQYAFAQCLEYGDGVAQDYAEAVRWYRLLAAQGYEYAQFRVGRLFREGLVTRRA